MAALSPLCLSLTYPDEGKFLHHVDVSIVHIYDRHVPIVEKILTNPQFNAPKFWINPEIKNFYDFTVNDFKLEGYEFTPLEDKIEVAV